MNSSLHGVVLDFAFSRSEHMVPSFPELLDIDGGDGLYIPKKWSIQRKPASDERSGLLKNDRSGPSLPQATALGSTRVLIVGGIAGA